MSFFSMLSRCVQVDAKDQYDAFMSRATSVREDYVSKARDVGYLTAITKLEKDNKEALKTAAFALACFTSFCFFSPYVTFGLAAAAGYLQPKKVVDLVKGLVKEFEGLQDQYKNYMAPKEARKPVKTEDRNYSLVSGVYFRAKVVAVAASAIFKFGQTVAVGSGLAIGVGLAYVQSKASRMIPQGARDKIIK